MVILISFTNPGIRIAAREPSTSFKPVRNFVDYCAMMYIFSSPIIPMMCRQVTCLSIGQVYMPPCVNSAASKTSEYLSDQHEDK